MNIFPFDIANVTPPPPVEIAGVDNDHIAWRLVSDLANSLSVFATESQSVHNDKVIAAIEMAKNLKPQDTFEAQLIAQMVAAHNVISESLHRANRPGQSDQNQTAWLRQATRFMTQFRQHGQALTNYRGTPKQMREDAEQQAWEAHCRAQQKAEAARQRQAQLQASKAGASNGG